MLASAAFERHCNVKRPTGRYISAHPGHCDAGNVLERDVRGGLRYEHEALVEAEEEPLVRLDRALDPGLLMEAASSSARYSSKRLSISIGFHHLKSLVFVLVRRLLRRPPSYLEKSFEGVTTFFPDRARNTAATTAWMGAS